MDTQVHIRIRIRIGRPWIPILIQIQKNDADLTISEFTTLDLAKSPSRLRRYRTVRYLYRTDRNTLS
jgi:hypothetical protein